MPRVVSVGGYWLLSRKGYFLFFAGEEKRILYPQPLPAYGKGVKRLWQVSSSGILSSDVGSAEKASLKSA